MDEIRIKSTSRVSAECSDICLRETTSSRLIFRPMIVENSNNPEASVKGNFLYQRRMKGQEWQDFETIPLSSVKSGEGYKLELSSAELLNFIDEIKPLYDIHKENGIPRGETRFIKSNPQLDRLALLSASDIHSLLAANRSLGTSLLAKLLNWAVNINDPAPLVDRLVELSTDSLSKLNAAVGLQSLKQALAIWEGNSNSKDEEFWQKALMEHSFVLEQVFCWPTSIVKGKAYIGGKSIFNSGGNIVDFLMKSRLTQSAALIEIKTPSTRLLGAEYRSGVYNTSSDLSGSIMQTLNYKQSLQESYTNLVGHQNDLFDSFNPQCAVIIGNATSELATHSHKRSFELFRHQFPGVVIITFDELFDKTRQLIRLLESPEENREEDDDIPF